MKAMDLMKYDAVAVGPVEFRVPLTDALANTVLNGKYSFDVVAANILNKDDAFPTMLKDYRIATVPGVDLKVGIIDALSAEVIKEIKKADPSLDPQPDPDTGKKPDPPIIFGRNPAALKALKDANPDIKLLLYQGSVEAAK